MLQLVPGGFLKAVEGDASPNLGGDLDGGGHNISNVGIGTFGILAISPVEQGVIRAVDGVLHGGSSHADLAELHQDVTTTANPSFAGLVVDSPTLVVDAVNGRVGVGTATPVKTFTVKSPAANNWVSVVLAADNSYLGGWFEKTDGSGLLIVKNAAGSTRVGLSAVGDSYFIGGNLGVGTTAPSEMFHIRSTTNHAKFVLEATSGSKNAGFLVKNAAARTGLVQFWEDAERIWSFEALESAGFSISEADHPYTGWTQRFFVAPGGNVGIGISNPTALLDVNSDILRLRLAKTPATEDAAGNAGDLCWDANYFYVCVGVNTWKRTALAAW